MHMDGEDVREIGGERYLAPKVVTERFGYTRDQIGQWARLGSVDAKLVGRVWYVSERDLLERRAKEEAAREEEEARQRAEKLKEEEAERARLEAEQKAQEQEDEQELFEEEPEPEPMTFAKRLAGRKPTQSSKSVQNAHHDGVLEPREGEIDQQEEVLVATEQVVAVEQNRPRASMQAVSTVRTIGIRTASPEQLRIQRERGQRQAQMLGSMHVRYEKGKPIEYSYDPVEPEHETLVDEVHQPTTPDGIAPRRTARRRPGTVSQPHVRTDRVRTAERPVVDAIKKRASAAPVRIAESSKPLKKQGADFVRPRTKEKKHSRRPRRRRALIKVLLWSMVVLVAIGLLYLAVIFFEGS